MTRPAIHETDARYAGADQESHASQCASHHDVAGYRHAAGTIVLRRELGLNPGALHPDGKFVYQCGGALIALFPKEAGTKPDHTEISFQVSDIAASVNGLNGAGVVFEDYDFPGLKIVDHVCVLGSEKAAWFKDIEGNYLYIHEDIP